MYFDRFDICEAYYLFLSDFHEGQGSSKYARLCRMLRYFRPAPNLDVDTLSENGAEIYAALAADEIDS